MEKYDFEELKKIDFNITKKLFSFIKKEVDIDLLNENLNIDLHFFQEENNKALFNTWLSIDYIDNTGKSFIDKFLDRYKDSLKPIERNMLISKNESFVSLFEILGYREEYMFVRDSLQDKEYQLWEPNLANVLDEGEFIFARIGKILGRYSYIGELNYLPFSVKSIFIEEFLIDYNRHRKSNISLTIKEYLKKHSMKLFSIYNDCILNILEYEEDITSYLYNEIYEFEGYLQNKAHSLTIKKHITNLIEFFEYYLAEDDYTLYDVDKMDFKYFFKEAVKDEFIISQEEFNSYLSTFIKYLSFLKNKSTEYKDTYMELLEISNNRFYYMNKLKSNSSPYNLDRNFVNNIALDLNERAVSLIIDFDRFILYAIDKKLELTEKNKYIKRKYLLELNSIFEENMTINRRNLNQVDFPIIHLFYQLSIKLGLMKIDGEYLVLTKKGTNFVRLKDEEKFTILFDFIWSKEFINQVTNINIKSIKIIKKIFVDMINSISPNSYCSLSTIISSFDEYPNFFIHYGKYLKYLGLIRLNLYPQYNFEVTSLGKNVFRILKDNEDRKENSIVSLESYRNKRNF